MYVTICKLLCFGIPFFLAIATNTFYASDEIDLVASVDKKTVPINTTIKLSVTMSSGLKSMDPILPDISDSFSILSRSQSTSYRWVNGVSSHKKSIHYILQPLKTGALHIDSIYIESQGKRVYTDPIMIQVNEGEAAQASGNLELLIPKYEVPLVSEKKSVILLEAKSDKETVFVGEPIDLSIIFYRRVNLWSDISIDLPAFEGFWVENLEKKPEYLTRLYGQKYYAFELSRKQLTPLKPGDFKIPPAQVAFVMNPFDGQKIIRSKSIDIFVKPLPEGAPEGFSGIVGDFSITGRLGQTDVTQNTPISVRITVEGMGAMKSINQLLHESEDIFKIYQSKIEDFISPTSNLILRHFEYILIPQKAGVLKAPVFSLVYFNPYEEIYQTREVDLGDIIVHAAELNRDNGATGSHVELNHGVRYLKYPQSDIALPIKTKAGYLFMLGLSLNAVAFIGIVGLLFLKKSVSFSLRNRGAPYRLAQESLKNFDMQNERALTCLQRILLRYLSEKDKGSYYHLTHENILELLSHKGIVQEDRDEVKSILENIAIAAYSSEAFSKDVIFRLCQRMQIVLKRLEKTWRHV